MTLTPPRRPVRPGGAVLALAADLRAGSSWSAALLRPVLSHALAVALLLPVAGWMLSRWWIGASTPAVALAPGMVAEEGSGAWLYALRTAGGVVLVDAGRDPQGRPIDAALRALGAARADVTDVFLTHGHPAETGGLPAVPGARVHAGAGDVDVVAGRARPGRGVDRMLALALPRSAVADVDPIAGEQESALGDDRLRAIPVPGHSAGSTAYLIRGVLFAGDALGLDGDRLVPGPRFMAADPERARRGVAALARRLAGVPVSRICTAHAGCSPEGSGSALLASAAAP